MLLCIELYNMFMRVRTIEFLSGIYRVNDSFWNISPHIKITASSK